MGGAYVNQNVPIEITWLAAIQNGGVIATNFRRCLTITAMSPLRKVSGAQKKLQRKVAIYTLSTKYVFASEY
jgi:hypothetical protein